MDSVTSKGLTLDTIFLLAAVAPSVARDISSVAGKQVAGLSKKTQRVRVSRAVAKLAADEGIPVSWLKLNVWLKADDVRLSVAAGDSDSLRDCAHLLTLEVPAEIRGGRPSVVSPQKVRKRSAEGRGEPWATIDCQ